MPQESHGLRAARKELARLRKAEQELAEASLWFDHRARRNKSTVSPLISIALRSLVAALAEIEAFIEQESVRYK